MPCIAPLTAAETFMAACRHSSGVPARSIVRFTKATWFIYTQLVQSETGELTIKVRGSGESRHHLPEDGGIRNK